MESDYDDFGDFFRDLAQELSAQTQTEEALHKAQFPAMHTAGWEQASHLEFVEEINFKLGMIVPAIVNREVLTTEWYHSFTLAMANRPTPPLFAEYIRSKGDQPNTKEQSFMVWASMSPLEALKRVAETAVPLTSEIEWQIFQSAEMGGIDSAKAYIRLFVKSDETADQIYNMIMMA